MKRKLNSQKRSDVPREYLKSADINFLLRKSFIDWGIVAACWLGMFLSSVYLWPIFLIIIGGRIHAFGVIIHDLTHLNFSPKTFKIRLIEVLMGYPIGTTVNAMAYHHLRHHRNTLLETDPYFNYNKKCKSIDRILLTLKKGPLLPYFWIIRSLVGFVGVFLPQIRTAYAKIFLQDISGKDLSRSKEVITCCKEDVPQAIFHILLLVLALNFPFIFYGYYLPLFIGGTFCIYRLLIEHEYDIVEDKSVYTMIECTFDHHTHWFSRMFLGPHNIGYHCMHHIHPKVGLQHLPRLRDWYLKNSPQYEEKYQNLLQS